MNTIHSILFTSALFCILMAAGMNTASGQTPACVSKQDAVDRNEAQARDCEARDCISVQDIRFLLIYHNPVRVSLPAVCLNPRPDARKPRGILPRSGSDGHNAGAA